MSYRERAVEAVKTMGQELIDRADELIPNAQRVSNINIWLRIPSLGETLEMPEIEVEVDVLPSKIVINKMIKAENE